MTSIRPAKSSAKRMLMVCCTTWWSGPRHWCHLLGHAKELVDEFEIRLRAQRGVKNGRGAGLKRGEQVVIETDASAIQELLRAIIRSGQQVRFASLELTI
jgi:hypothetical protein